MVHNAYDSFQLVKGCPAKIESVGVWGCRVLVGCIDGSLRIYAPESLSISSNSNISRREIPSDGGSGIIEAEPYVLERTLVGFCKKAVICMDVLQSRSLLLSLSDAITLHRLPGFEVAVYIGKTKGSSSYAWDDKRGFLCVNKQKKLLIYRYDGSREFAEMKEFAVPDVVKSMAWCGEGLCLGIRREYVILNTVTGAFFEVFPCGRIAPPLVVSLPSGELLLGKDNIGVFVDQNGKLLQEGRICWSEAPVSVAIHLPYAIAQLPRHIEIRSLRAPYPLVQTYPLRDVHLLLSSSNCVVAALENSAYCLLPVPIGAQVVQLAASGNFDEALALCKLLPPEDSTLRASKEDSIHIRYGQYLFDNGSYEEAMQQFLASSLDISAILCLYPSLKLPKNSNDTSSKYMFESSSDMLYEQHLAKTFSNASDEAESGSLSQDEDKCKSSSGKLNHNSLSALIKFLSKRRKRIIGKAAAEDTDEVVAAVVEDASSSVNSWRSSSSVKHSSNTKGGRSAREKATILDTALVQCLLLTGQSSGALELLSGPNYCDVKICEEFMLQRGHYLELIELYKYNERHRDALKLLNHLVAGSDSLPVPPADTQKLGPESIIEYLKPLGGLDPALVLDCSTWILEACPQQTIELFSSTDPPLPPNLVSSYLKQHAPHMQVTYLEHMLALHGNALSSSLQNELVQIYLVKVLDEYAELKGQEKWDERQNSIARQKLLAALEKTSGYNAELLLKRLPPDALYEERAFLLGKMERHQLALTLYAHKLREPELALGYCDLIYNTATSVMSGKNTSSLATSQQRHSGQRAALNIYLTLLQVYLNPQASKKEFDQTIAVLNSSKEPATYKIGSAQKAKGHKSKKVVEIIERIEDNRQSLSSTSTDSAPESGRSDGEESFEASTNVEGMMLDEALNLLSRRWDRINGAEALRLLPSDIKLQLLLPFLEPLLKKSSEARRNLSVIKSLRHSENLQAAQPPRFDWVRPGSNPLWVFQTLVEPSSNQTRTTDPVEPGPIPGGLRGEPVKTAGK
ncbi:hypothetical protein SUGI_0338060 [Cryptomeria japonica]|nr:hypothetical protein SUGI_0338060 [Cryptomeria japonica]